MANARVAELRRDGSLTSDGRPGLPPAAPGPDTGASVTLRFAFPDDGVALWRLAALDSSEPLTGPVLLADVGGELWAALSLSDGRVIADPFRSTTALIELLRARARQLDAPAARSRRLLAARGGLRHRPSTG